MIKLDSIPKVAVMVFGAHRDHPKLGGSHDSSNKSSNVVVKLTQVLGIEKLGLKPSSVLSGWLTRDCLWFQFLL